MPAWEAEVLLVLREHIFGNEPNLKHPLDLDFRLVRGTTNQRNPPEIEIIFLTLMTSEVDIMVSFKNPPVYSRRFQLTNWASQLF